MDIYDDVHSVHQKWLDTLQEPVPQTKRREKISYKYTSPNNFWGTTQNRVDLSPLRFYLCVHLKKTMYSARIDSRHFTRALFIPVQPFATAPGYLKGPYIHWFTCSTLLASVVNFDLIKNRNARGERWLQQQCVGCKGNITQIRRLFWTKPAIQLNTTHSRTHVYTNIFICFSVKNPLLKLVFAFQIRPVRRAGTTKSRVEMNNKCRDLLIYLLTYLLHGAESFLRS